MRLKSFHTSAWLVLGSALLAIEINSAAASPYNASVVKPALRLKGAIGAVFDTQGLHRAAAHEKLPSEIGYADFGPLEWPFAGSDDGFRPSWRFTCYRLGNVLVATLARSSWGWQRGDAYRFFAVRCTSVAPIR
jgi:hypothetical protein